MKSEFAIRGNFKEVQKLRSIHHELTKICEEEGTLVSYESTHIDDRAEGSGFFYLRRESEYIFPKQETTLLENASNEQKETNYKKGDEKKKYKYNEQTVGSRIKLTYKDANFFPEVTIHREGPMLSEKLKAKLEELINS